jgi:AraC family transcriptional activator FtrA
MWCVRSWRRAWRREEYREGVSDGSGPESCETGPIGPPVSYRPPMAVATAVVAYDDAELLDIACVTTTLATATRFLTGEHTAHSDAPPDTTSDRAGYDIRLLTVGGRPVTARPGLRLEAHGALERDTGPVDTLVVVGGYGHLRAAHDDVLVAHVRRLARQARRVASVCTGASVLAAAGLLDGRRATTHWRHAATLAARYPRAQVEPSVLYVQDGTVYTAAGSAAGIDLGLHLVRQDYGSAIANQVARRMVVPPHRDGGQSQFVAAAMPSRDGSLAPIMEWASARLDQPLDAAALARKGRMSLRTLARRFEHQAGTTPHQWLTHQRVLTAQRLLETSDASVERVAELAGFATPETLRHHFRRRVGTSPVAYRRRFAQSV